MFAEDKGLPPDRGQDLWTGLRAAVAHDLMALAVLHNQELNDDLIGRLRSTCFPDGLRLQLCSDQGKAAASLTRHAIDGLPESMDQAVLDELAADYADIYLTHALGASPYESVWIDDDGLVMQEPMFQVREYYRRHSLRVQDWRKRSDDHLVHQLHFLSHGFTEGSHDANLEELARFMDEHLLRWLPDFATRVAARCATSLYAGLALLTMAYVEELRDLLSEILGLPRPRPGEIEARMRPKPSVVVTPPKYVPGTAPSW